MLDTFRGKAILADRELASQSVEASFESVARLHWWSVQPTVGGEYKLVAQSSNAHFRATGHMRFVFQTASGPRWIMHCMTRPATR